MFVFNKTEIPGLILIDPPYHEDDRGVLKKVFEKNIFETNGISLSSMEEIETTSRKGVLRGLHYQTKHSQAKLVRVARGEIFDVAVDLREGSATYGRYYGIAISSRNRRMLYIPAGFAHGCLAMEEQTVFYYLCSQDYHPEYDSGLRWDDPRLGIEWPLENGAGPILSEKDRQWPDFVPHRG